MASSRTIARVFQADPLVCRRCGGPLRVLAYVTDALAIRQILEHLDLSPSEKPPPEIRDVVRAPVMTRGERSSSSQPDCPEPISAWPRSGRGVCAGQSRRDIPHPQRATRDA